MPKTAKKKKVASATPAPEENLTYRLSLTDSANRAVQIDVSLDSLLKGVERLMAKYKDLLDDEARSKRASEQHDEEVAKNLEKTEKEKLDALPTNTCAICNKTWKGGTELCQDPECEGSKEQPK